MREWEELAARMEGVVLQRAHFRLGPVHLEVPAGYVTAIVGPNGSGKSSTLRMLMELSRPDAGRIEIFGEALGPGSDAVARKRRIGYLPEEAYEYERGFRGSDKAAFVRQWYPQWDVNRYQELLRLFEVDPGLKLGKMSKGMRRKFELALSLAHHPELLLLDEPSSGLDPLAWRAMIGVLHAFMETGGRTVLISTHIIEEVKRLADYIVVMAHGRVLGMYEKDELLTGWRKLFLRTGEAASGGGWEAMPGYAGSTGSGGGTLQLVTGRAAEAERWLAERGIVPVASQPMELDDIMAIMVENDKLRMPRTGDGKQEKRGAGQ